MTNAQQKELDYYVKTLNITSEGEKFVLLKLLELGWRKITLMRYIKECNNTCGLISVKCGTNVSNYNTSVPDIKSTGWKEGMTDSDKRYYVIGDLYRKIK
jgi:hypothetical protein